MAFRIGQRVVCVNGNKWSPSACSRQVYPALTPSLDQVYRITEIEFVEGEGETFLVLAEFGDAFSWVATSFRPVVERTTDIGVFTEILNKTRVPVDDDALHASIDMGQR
jgi:hypothetical protein